MYISNPDFYGSIWPNASTPLEFYAADGSLVEEIYNGDGTQVWPLVTDDPWLDIDVSKVLLSATDSADRDFLSENRSNSDAQSSSIQEKTGGGAWWGLQADNNSNDEENEVFLHVDAKAPSDVGGYRDAFCKASASPFTPEVAQRSPWWSLWTDETNTDDRAEGENTRNHLYCNYDQVEIKLRDQFGVESTFVFNNLNNRPSSDLEFRNWAKHIEVPGGGSIYDLPSVNTGSSYGDQDGVIQGVRIFLGENEDCTDLIGEAGRNAGGVAALLSLRVRVRPVPVAGFLDSEVRRSSLDLTSETKVIYTGFTGVTDQTTEGTSNIYHTDTRQNFDASLKVIPVEYQFSRLVTRWRPGTTCTWSTSRYSSDIGSEGGVIFTSSTEQYNHLGFARHIAGATGLPPADQRGNRNVMLMGQNREYSSSLNSVGDITGTPHIDDRIYISHFTFIGRSS